VGSNPALLTVKYPSWSKKDRAIALGSSDNCIAALVLGRCALLGGVCVVLVVVMVYPDALTLSSSAVFLITAKSSSVLLVPGTERLASKHEVVILDDGGDHPWLVAQVDLIGGRV